MKQFGCRLVVAQRAWLIVALGATLAQAAAAPPHDAGSVRREASSRKHAMCSAEHLRQGDYSALVGGRGTLAESQPPKKAHP
jgi:hypothetical protein